MLENYKIQFNQTVLDNFNGLFGAHDKIEIG
jgi:hypothetical protein